MWQFYYKTGVSSLTSGLYSLGKGSPPFLLHAIPVTNSVMTQFCFVIIYKPVFLSRLGALRGRDCVCSRFTLVLAQLPLSKSRATDRPCPWVFGTVGHPSQPLGAAQSVLSCPHAFPPQQNPTARRLLAIAQEKTSVLLLSTTSCF